MIFLKRSLLLLVLAYFGLCLFIYYQQKHLLFPAYQAKPVPVNWQPHAGDTQQQAMIKGHCGQLHIALWKIKNAKGTLMMFHGNGESLASIDEYAYAFHQLGYNLMAWDYPGYGRSTDCWFSQNDLLADAESAYQWLATKENPERIFIFGYSIGTGIALSVASHHQKNPVYLVAAYDALVNVAIDYMPKFLPVEIMISYPLNTSDWLVNFKQRIYLIHGTNDALIKPQRAQSLVEKTQQLALPYPADIEWVQGAGHTDDQLFLYRNQWLKRRLP